MIRNHQPYARPTYNGERRPVAWEGGEWLSELPRPPMTLRPSQWLLAFTLGALSWGLAAVVAVIVFSVQHG